MMFDTIIDQYYFTTVVLDIVAIQMLVGICLIPRYIDGKDRTGRQIFSGMGICIVVGAVFDLVCRILASGLYGWGGPVVLISKSLSDISIMGFMFFFLLFTDYELFSSRYHLKRHFGPYLIPLAVFVIAYIVNLFTGIFFGVSEDLYVLPTSLYYILKIVEYIYLIMPVIHYMLGLAKVDTKAYLHPFSIYVPILLGEIITIFTPLTAVYLGCSIGITFLVFSRIDLVRFEDKETSFFNLAYLKHIFEQMEEGSEKRGSMIVFDTKGSKADFAEILREALPGKSEVISLPGGRFVFLSDNESGREIKGLTSLVLDNCAFYDEENPEKTMEAKGAYHIFKDTQDLKNKLQELIGSFS